MDLYKVIRQLYDEKARLDRVIASLEELQRAAEKGEIAAATGKRGRKGMDAKERQEVSERMKQYWAARRKEQQKKGSRATGDGNPS